MRRSPLAIIFFTVFLDLIGFGLVLPLLPSFAKDHHAQEWQIGLLMASYSLMQFFFAPVWGRLSDRIGRRPVLLVSITGSALSYLLFAFAPNLVLLFVSRMFAGIMAANISTAQAYIADVTAPEDRAKGMGMIGAAFGLGFVFGPALGAALSHSQQVLGLTAAGFSLLDLLLAASLLPESLTPEIRARAAAPVGNRMERMAHALRHPTIGPPILVFFLSTVAWSQLEPTAARLSQEEFHFTKGQTGLMFVYVGIIVALIQGGFAGRMARRSGESRMILTGTLLLAIGLALVPAMRSTTGLLVALAVLAAGQAMNVPGLQSLISRSTAAEEQGSTLGVSQGFSSLARAIGPAIGGWLFGVQHAYPFWFGSAIMVVAFLLSGRIAAAARRDPSLSASR
jgi:DHA1 family tetracycline resistance protein-like MFS transporter